MSTVLTDANGTEIKGTSDTADLSEVTANISLGGMAKPSDGTTLATIILAVYGEKGKLVTLN